MMDEVLHVVTYKKDEEIITVEVMATDPSNAINKIRRELK